MRLLTRLERTFGRFAVPNLTLGLIACQVVVYFATEAVNARRNPDVDPPAHAVLDLVPEKVLAGEVWRLVTFLILPPLASLLWALLFWYAFYLFGTALEAAWGTFRYNLYLFVGYLAIAGAAFLTPAEPASNAFLSVTVFLAVAWLAPEMTILLFFVLPVPIKWLARLTWAGVVIAFALGDWSVRAQVTASVANFLLFFGREIWELVVLGRRAVAGQAARVAAEVRKPSYYHKCRVCGITDRSHPQTDFRYCSKCAGQCCYCAEHLKNHEHVTG
jgi:hypothetical protein